MSQNNQQHGTPDLDENIHVAEAHASDATSRETTISEDNKAVPMWIYGVALVAALGAGSIFGKAGNFFNYTNQFKDGYLRELNPEGGAEAKPPVWAVPKPTVLVLLEPFLRSVGLSGSQVIRLLWR